jgi:diguanylate cyclase (GGDEF)-like protein
MCDIDHFKNINDTYGHLAGDEYLKLISSCLSEVFKRETDVIGRYGGEEFIILLPDEKAEMTQGLAETFRKHIEASPLIYGKENIRTTVSIGMTCCVPQSGTTIKSLINEADKALYSAKNTGRNRIAINGELCDKVIVP